MLQLKDLRRGRQLLAGIATDTTTIPIHADLIDPVVLRLHRLCRGRRRPCGDSVTAVHLIAEQLVEVHAAVRCNIPGHLLLLLALLLLASLGALAALAAGLGERERRTVDDEKSNRRGGRHHEERRN